MGTRNKIGLVMVQKKRGQFRHTFVFASDIVYTFWKTNPYLATCPFLSLDIIFPVENLNGNIEAQLSS